MNENNSRNVEIDILKGIGILLMVAGHSGVPFTRFIYLFHMAIFFIASGYCYKVYYSDSLENTLIFMKKRFISLWIPYVFWGILYTVLNNWFIHLNIYTDNPLILNYTNVGGAIKTTKLV